MEKTRGNLDFRQFRVIFLNQIRLFQLMTRKKKTNKTNILNKIDKSVHLL